MQRDTVDYFESSKGTLNKKSKPFYVEDRVKSWVVYVVIIVCFVLMSGIFIGVLVIAMYLKDQYRIYCRIFESIFLYT